MKKFCKGSICPKCGNDNILITYISKKPTLIVPILEYIPPDNGEYFHRSCRKCRYNWPEACLTEEDLKKKSGMPSIMFDPSNIGFINSDQIGFSTGGVLRLMVDKHEIIMKDALLEKRLQICIRALEVIANSDLGDCCQATLDRIEQETVPPVRVTDFRCGKCRTQWEIIYSPNGKDPLQIAMEALKEVKKLG